jgi:hypothetical protein
VAQFTCQTCGEAIEQDQSIRIGCRLYPVQAQDPPAFAVTRPREIFLFHEEHAPAPGGHRTGGYEMAEATTLAVALASGEIIIG